MSDPRLYIFDADGTLRRCTVPGQPCPNKPGEWELMPGVKDRLAKIDWTQAGFAIASNQGGVGLGFMDAAEARGMLVDTMIAATDGLVLPQWSVRMCTHAPSAGCGCRKPMPGMLIDACHAYDADPSDAIFVGDQDSDRLAAEAAGIPFVVAEKFFGWVTEGVDKT